MILHLQGGEKLNISDKAGEEIKQTLLMVTPPLFIEIDGQTIKTNTIKAVLKDNEVFTSSKDEFYWSDKELEDWEKEIFDEELGIKTFNEYLLRERVIIINSKFPNGAVRDPEKYRLLQAKWNKLNELRFKREKGKDFSEVKAKIKKSIGVFTESVEIPKVDLKNIPF